MDDAELSIVNEAAAAAVEAAMRRQPGWRMIPGVVVDFDTGSFQASVIPDGANQPITAYVSVGTLLRPGDRVLTTFTNPGGAFVTGFVGLAPAVVGRWYSGALVTIPAYGTEILPWPVTHVVSHEELFRIQGDRIYTNIDGWFRVDTTVQVGSAQSSVDITANEPSGGRGYWGNGNGTGYVLANTPVYMDLENYIQVVVTNQTGSSSTAHGGILLTYLGA